MNLSRRELSFLIPWFGLEVAPPDAPSPLPTNIYHPEQITDLKGQPKKGTRIFFGKDHSGFQLEMHETVLGPGVESHPPHKHIHEEIMVVLAGTLQTWVEGKTAEAEMGAVIYFGSNQMHKVPNRGQVLARYYVLELRGQGEA